MPLRPVSVFLVVLAAALGAPVASAQAEVATEPGPPVVVRFDPGTGDQQRLADLVARGLEVVDRLPGSDFVLAAPTGRGASLSTASSHASSIADLAPLVPYQAFGVPDDQYYPYQWHLPAIGAASAWDVTTGTGTVVAVLDTGVAYEDDGLFLQAPDLGGTSFAPGWDFIDGDAQPNDENGHGTHVASTIAATTGNSEGVAGVAPGVTIMPLRVLDANGSGSDWQAAQALRFAADHGAAVANLSLGGAGPSSIMADAIAYARANGVTIVGSTGNEGGAVSYPAAYDDVIAVGAVRRDLTRPSYSNFGAALDLVAPGGDLSVDQDGDGYRDGILQETFLDSPTDFCLCFFQGTSMAAPQVAAVAALVAARGVDDPAVIQDLLTATALDLGAAGRDDHYGHGLVQAGAAVRAPIPDGEPLGPSAAPGAVRGIEHACPAASTPVPTFTDLAGSVHAGAVGCVAWWEVASGRTAQRFEPDGQVTRAQLASFVARMIEAAGSPLPISPPDAFTDDESSTHERRIDQLAAVGVVQGRGGTTYAPSGIVTRAEMATFLARAHDLVADEALAAGTDRFDDDDSSTHEANIDKVAAAGLAAGTSSTTFAPTAPVLRGQMATFLARTLDLFVATGATPPR